MFRGSVTVNVDDKGRFAIPSRHRESALNECNDGNENKDSAKFVFSIAVSSDGTSIPKSLWLHTLKDWKEFEQKLEELESTDENDISDFRRLLIGTAFDTEMDSQGRVMLPDSLRKFADLYEKKIVLAGNRKRIELWTEEDWNIRLNQMKAGSENSKPIPRNLTAKLGL